MLPLALAAVIGLAYAGYKLMTGPNVVKIANGLNLSPVVVDYAIRWGRKRGLPLEWILATILVESSGKATAVGDGGKSIGLMQVNAAAHGAELAAAGLTADNLFDVGTNIEWGTKYMHEFRQKILSLLGGKAPPIPIDEILRLSYKGPATVYAALKAGRNPAAISWAPDALVNWRKAMGRVRALTGGSLLS